MLVQKGILSNEAMPQEVKEGTKHLFVGAPTRIRTPGLPIPSPLQVSNLIADHCSERSSVYGMSRTLPVVFLQAGGGPRRSPRGGMWGWVGLNYQPPV